jgi:hypothetical protein
MPTGFVMPRWLWALAAVAALIVGLRVWFDVQLSTARREGAAEQAFVDRRDFARAESVATERQAAIKARTAAKAATISKGTDDALQVRYYGLARSYDDLRLRWAAHRADQGGAGNGGAARPAGAAGETDDAYCKAQGWVSLDVAAAAAQAADTAIAKDDAWREWWTAQAEAWPD